MGVIYRVKVPKGEGSSNRSLRQGCPSRDGIGRKSAANLRPEDYEPQVRLAAVGRACQTKQSPCYRRLLRVNGAGRWRKDNVLTRGGLPDTPIKFGNPCRDVRLNRQESAEAIVPARKRPSREGPNMIVREVHGKLERKAKTAKSQKRATFRRKW